MEVGEVAGRLWNLINIVYGFVMACSWCFPSVKNYSINFVYCFYSDVSFLLQFSNLQSLQPVTTCHTQVLQFPQSFIFVKIQTIAFFSSGTSSVLQIFSNEVEAQKTILCALRSCFAAKNSQEFAIQTPWREEGPSLHGNWKENYFTQVNMHLVTIKDWQIQYRSQRSILLLLINRPLQISQFCADFYIEGFSTPLMGLKTIISEIIQRKASTHAANGCHKKHCCMETATMK